MSKQRIYWLKRIARETGHSVVTVCRACFRMPLREIVEVYERRRGLS